LGLDLEEVLACGAELKNTLCLTRGRYAILSQHIGDLENYEAFQFFQETLANLKKLLRIEPYAVAYDLHPRYLSSRFALALSGVEKIGVQHHHAHIVSCMAENGVRETVIGVALDGAGYGTDGKIWGGEFLVADSASFRRCAQLRNILLAGGDAAVRQPWRAAVAYLRDTFGRSLPQLALWQSIPVRELSVVQQMLTRGLNTVETSSCGRLFDAVASILNVRHVVSFEGQAAIELESLAAAGCEEGYPFSVAESEPWQIDLRPAIREIVSDVSSGRPVSLISVKFHNTVADVIADVCRRLRGREGLNRVCLSGGVFQNTFLLERALRRLRSSGFEVFLHSRVPPNDGGISLGQAVVANAILHNRQSQTGARHNEVPECA
jgi:hydrogenase maturation protein HypF